MKASGVQKLTFTPHTSELPPFLRGAKQNLAGLPRGNGGKKQKTERVLRDQHRPLSAAEPAPNPRLRLGIHAEDAQVALVPAHHKALEPGLSREKTRTQPGRLAFQNAEVSHVKIKNRGSILFSRTWHGLLVASNSQGVHHFELPSRAGSVPYGCFPFGFPLTQR